VEQTNAPTSQTADRNHLLLVAASATQASETTFNAPMWQRDRLD